MSGDRRRRLRARYLSLGLGEFAAATTFAVLAVLQLGPQVRDPGGSWLWYAPVAPLLVVLVQAGCYWLAARRWVAAGPMPERLALRFAQGLSLRVLTPPLDPRPNARTAKRIFALALAAATSRSA